MARTTHTLDPFIGPRLKAKRASQLLRELHEIENKFWQGCSPDFVKETNPQTGNYLLKVVIGDVPPEECHILTAEIIYHLRSGLDQIAVALARLSTNPPNVKNIYFPSGDSLKGFIKSRKANTRGIDPDLLKLIIRTKPYDGGNNALRSIFRLANIDKHLELIPAVNTGRLDGLYHFEVISPTSSLEVSNRFCNANDGIKLWEFAPDGGLKPRHPDAKINISGCVTFGNVSVYDGVPIVAKLSELIQLFASLLQTFIDHCRRTGRIS